MMHHAHHAVSLFVCSILISISGGMEGASISMKGGICQLKHKPSGIEQGRIHWNTAAGCCRCITAANWVNGQTCNTTRNVHSDQLWLSSSPFGGDHNWWPSSILIEISALHTPHAPPLLTLDIWQMVHVECVIWYIHCSGCSAVFKFDILPRTTTGSFQVSVMNGNWIVMCCSCDTLFLSKMHTINII